MEKHLFLKNRKEINLFGDLFIPESKIKNVGIVFCSPIAEERNIIRRICINAARYLCSYGYHILVFDYYGEGDSGGNFEEATILSRISDVEDSLLFFKKECNLKRVGLLGARLGAAIGLLSANERTNADFIILWQPVIQGSSYLYNWLRSNLASQLLLYKQVKITRDQLIENLKREEIVEIDGFIVTGELSKQLMEIDLVNPGFISARNILLIETLGSTNEASPISYKFIEALRSVNKEVSHNLIKKTFDWDNMKLYDPAPVKLFSHTLSWLNNLHEGI